MVTIAVLAATGGAAWAVWQISGSQISTTTVGSGVELRLAGLPHPDVPLYPGAKSDLRVTVKNDNTFPVRVSSVRPGPGGTTVDEAHRNAGCLNTGVSLTANNFTVLWRIPARSSREFLLPGSVRMTNSSDSACQGGAFTIPLTASGRSDAS
ncbi:hypothetical protein AB0M02_02555 [Actinoplanes sp. NPDC051861]|uniref:hypothetical protein n=1 Tax=Actinoplanes sp. NPDC051861 TaxID=3155170 RepID=UPI00341E69AA